ncbi:MAG: EF-P beta-lysylation protein EpmB [Planctomycetaceae bacterium]|jgi:L-lysine 2,3-aminomutase|nr:EF-P beta-lysylation protein EpmB [Planctomycetaceae bacterium]
MPPTLLQSKLLRSEKPNLEVEIEIPTWQHEIKTAFRLASDLCEFLNLDLGKMEISALAAKQFPLFVPRGFARRMENGNPDDPLLRQVLNVVQEEVSDTQFSVDPVGESGAGIAPGLLQKYAGRALMVVTGVCAVHCRYCFRRHFPYQSFQQIGAENFRWQPALDTIRNDASIHEVLLSGGDPLVLSDELLTELITMLENIPHLKRLRIHTRLPIVIPSRVTEALVNRLASSRLAVWFVVHANHGNELETNVLQSLDRIVTAGIPVLNQTVLLRGVNDSVGALEELFAKLADASVLPYYLHQLDRVAGAAHFEVPIETGKQLIKQLRTRLPGYAVPRYVQELPDELAKTILA